MSEYMSEYKNMFEYNMYEYMSEYNNMSEYNMSEYISGYNMSEYMSEYNMSDTCPNTTCESYHRLQPAEYCPAL